MCRLRAHSSVLTVVLLVSLAVALPAHAQQKLPDSTLFTLYSSNQPPTEISWQTCGSTPQTEGCYGGGSFGPFTNACAIVQSVPGPLNLNTVLRYIYILDAGATTGGATLTAYKRTDMVTQTTDIITITQLAVVPLPKVAGGPGATCVMSQNPTNVYASTYQSTYVTAINKSNFSVTSLGGFGVDVSALTADSYGYVTIVWGSGFDTQFATYGPIGQLEESGGGGYFMINPIDAVYPSNYPTLEQRTLPRVGYWPKVTK